MIYEWSVLAKEGRRAIQKRKWLGQDDANGHYTFRRGVLPLRARVSRPGLWPPGDKEELK